MTPERLAEIKARYEKAAKGRWSYKTGTRYLSWVILDSTGLEIATLFDDMFDDNARFITHTRQDVPDLVVRVEELEKERQYWFSEASDAHARVNSLCVELEDAKKTIKALYAELSDVQDTDDEYAKILTAELEDAKKTMLEAEIAKAETASAVAAWLDDNYGDSRFDGGMLREVTAEIRAGAWRKEEGGADE